MTIYEPGSGLSPDTKSAGALILDFQASKNCEKQIFYYL